MPSFLETAECSLKVDTKSAQQGFPESRLPTFTPDQKLLVQGSADFFGLNYYTGLLAENKVSDINVVDYSADQDLETSYDPSWYG